MDPIGIQTVKIDIRKKAIIQDPRDKSIPTFIEGDTNRLIFDLYNNGVAADLSNIGRAVANFKAGSAVYSRLSTVDGSTIIYDLGAEESATVGVSEVEIQLYNADNTSRVSTMRVKVYVSKAIGEAEINPAEPEYTALQELFIEVDGNSQYAKTQGDYAKAQGDAVDTKVATEVASQVPVAVDEKVGQLTNLQTEDKSSVVGAVNEVTAQLAQNQTETKENKRAVNYYWLPETQPPARKDLEGWFTDAYNLKPDQYLEQFFEPLRLENTNYITRTLLGKDASNTYDIWRYELTPKEYSKTIILSTCLHGNEVTGLIAMMRFLHYLVREYEKYPALSYIRENVRIIYIPFVNPWGVSQLTPRTRYNANGVDINRNFDFHWEELDPNGTIQPYQHGYKGTAPFSEVETRYVRDTVAAFPSAIAYFDFHNTGAPTNYDFYYVIPKDYKGLEFDRLVEYFSVGMTNPVVHTNQDYTPNACNYVYDTFRIPTAHPEWCDVRRGQKLYDSTEITGALAWYSNVIIEFVRNYKKEPFMIEGYYNHGTTAINLNVGSYAELQQFRIPIKITSHGLLKVSYVVGLFNNDLTATNYLAPVIEQSGSPVLQLSTGHTEIYSNNNTSRTTLNPSTSKYVYPSEKGVGEAVIKLYGYTTAGTNFISRLRVNVEFIPLENKNGYKMISATGRADQGTDAFQVTWRT